MSKVRLLTKHYSRDFITFWMAIGFSGLADGFLLVAVPLAAIALTSSPILIAAVTAMRFITIALSGAIIGRFIEEIPPRLVLLLTNITRIALVLIFLLFFISAWRSIWILIVLQIGIGLLSVIFDSTYLSVITLLVKQDQLDSANANVKLLETVTNDFVGPALVALMLQWGLVLIFFATLMIYGCSLAFLVLARIQTPITAKAGNQVKRAIIEGMHFLWQKKDVRFLILITTFMNFTFGAFGAVYIIYVTKDLGMPQNLYSLLTTALPVGAFLGASFSGLIVHYISQLNRLSLASLLIAMSTMLMLVFRSFVGLYISGVVAGIGTILWSSMIVTLLQKATPQELQVRLFANAKAVTAISLPIGAICAGVITDIFSSYILYASLLVYQALILVFLILRLTWKKVAQLQA